MKIKEIFSALIGITEYQERRKIANKFRVECSELVELINWYRAEKSQTSKEQFIPNIAKLADNFSKTCRELSIVIGDDQKVKVFAGNIFLCVEDILMSRSTIRELKANLSDTFEQRTDDFESFAVEAKKIISECEKVTTKQIGCDSFGDKLNDSHKFLMQYTKPISNAIFYSKTKMVEGGK